MKTYMHDIDPEEPRIPPERSIRHIERSETRARMMRPAPSRPPIPEESPRRNRRGGIWIAALGAAVFLGGLIAIILLPETTVTIVPRTQTVPFDASTPFTALPVGTTTGGISYRIVEESFEDSVVVPASGVEFGEELAKGTITVFNAYSDDTVRLIKNTRFETSDGKVFRIQNSIEVPGRTGATPGSIQVEVFADQVGPSYNVGPFDRLTLPGLAGTPDMFAKVYASSVAPFTDGFSGERPSVPQATLENTRAEIRARLSEKVRAIQAPEGTIIFPDLASLTYEEIVPQEESDGVRVGERVLVRMPVFESASFAQAVGQAVSASAEGNTISIVFSDSASAVLATQLPATSYGVEPLVFSLSGVSQLIWQVDEAGIADALAGKEESAFQAIVGAYPAVEEARARLVPFWRTTFPEDPSSIRIAIEEPPKPF